MRKETQVFGRIKYYNHAKGIGFIVDEATQEQFFFHWSNFKYREIPAAGAYVTFEIGPGITPEKKSQAVGIRFATVGEVKAFEEAKTSVSGANALRGGAQ